MINDIFRPAAFWKTAIMTMPDNSFYELIRSVFGKIKTPFNKQQLLNDLEAFLLREDIQKTIFEYIDETDIKIITATALFGEPEPEQLECFFSDEINPAELQDVIVNMEERFILYRFTEEKKTFLALNPVLKTVLLSFTANTSLLFPAAPINTPAEPSSAIPVINDLTLAALYSFVCKHESFYKSDGDISKGFRKRIIEEGKNLFPGIDLENVLGALQVLGLFYAEADRIIPEKKYFYDFGKLSERERMEYCTAAFLVNNEIAPVLEILPPLYRRRIQEIVILIQSFINSLEAGSQYPVKTLKRMLEIIKAKTNTQINTEPLFEELRKTGLIIRTSTGLIQSGNISANKINNKPVIAIDSGSSILVYPEINFNDAINLVSFLSLPQSSNSAKDRYSEAGTVIRLELDKDSAVRAFDENITAEEIIELLNRLSGGKTSDTLIWNIKDWEKRHADVSLKKGVILKLSQEHCYLAETKPLNALITETLAPGLYLLNEKTADDAAQALQKAGIDIIARKKEKKRNILSSINNFIPTYSRTSLQENAATLTNNSASHDEKNDHDNDTCLSKKKSGFHTVLGKMPMGEAERTELAARIERLLILCEAQLKDADIRYEKLEARHMDYAGKQNIAKLAISGSSPVEIVLPGKENEKRIFGIPKALEKEGNELILVVNTMSMSEDKSDDYIVRRIPLAKISLLRRIKKSIFEK